MQQAELTVIKSLVEKYRDMNLGDLLSNAYPDTDLNQLKFLEYTGAELIALSNRLISQFLDEIDTENSRFWQPNFDWATSSQPTANRSLAQVLQQLIDYVGQGSWEGCTQFLELAIGFQICHGFWDKSTARRRNSQKLKYLFLFEDLETKSNQISILMGQIQSLKEEQEKSVTLRIEEAQAASVELDSIKRQEQEIAGILQTASGTNGQLTSLLSSQKSNFEITATELAQIEKQRIEIGISIESLNQTLKGAADRLKHMEEKEKWVNELAGTAAAGVLGHKFEARKNQLGASSGWWLAGTVASIFFAAAWLGISHIYFVNHTDDIWKTLALNFGLLLPAIFIVGFFAKQFSKVRQYEEEYAFRSAIAMTLGAFADRLKKDDAEYNKLILDTVEKLYKMPVLLHEREPSGGLLSRNSPEATVNAVSALVKEIKALPGT